MPTELRNFLAIPYDELEEMNLKAKKQRLDRVAPHKIQEERLRYLTDESRLKAVTVMFSDLEGRLHMLDYDKKFLLKGYDTLNAANEIEGFLFQGPDAERSYHETGKFEYVNTGGYYHSLPGDPLRNFIDTTAEVQRAMGFPTEKHHPEVAPSQFEINYN